MAQRNGRSTGKLKCFDWELGTGFITPDGGGEDVFVQRSSIMPGDLCNLAEDRAVEFSVSWAGGNPKAIDVTSGGAGGDGDSDGRGGGGSHYNNREKGRFDKECLSLKGPPIVIDISSSTSEEDDDGEDEEDEEDEEEEEEEEDEKEVIGNESPQSSSMTIKTKEERNQEEEECCILGFDPFQPPTVDFKDKLALSDWHPSNTQDDDISVIAERGKVACRDYPHSRHLCVKYPFNTADHESFCLQCYCYVCDAAAPCEFWKGSIGHCHASDQDQKWKDRRMAHRGKLADNYS